MSVQDGYWSYV